MLNAVLLTAWIGCQGLDLGTTVVALNRTGYVEGNPIMRGRHLVPVKVSVNVGVFIWRRSMTDARQRHAVAGIFAAAGCTAATLNLRTLAHDPAW